MHLLSYILYSLVFINLSLQLTNPTKAYKVISKNNEKHHVSAQDSSKESQLIVIQKDSLKTKRAPISLKKLVDEVVKQTNTVSEVEMEIDGLLVDDTKTKMGKDFYDLFYGNWEAPPGAKNFTITVSEKPFRLTSILIVVSINENPVYQSVLQPRQEVVEALSFEAISTTQSYLANYEEIMKQLNGDDMAGSGIY